LYPVGSIYINATDNTNPATLFGFGTWSAFGAGRVPVGFDSSNALFDTASETGGSYDAVLVSHNHTGTTGNITADHSHTFSGTTDTQGNHQHVIPHNYDSGSAGDYISGNDGDNNMPGNASPTAFAGSHAHNYSGTTSGVSSNHQHPFTTSTQGSSATNANIQPYITVYMWRRTA
jgi:hypothetical protein